LVIRSGNYSTPLNFASVTLTLSKLPYLDTFPSFLLYPIGKEGWIRTLGKEERRDKDEKVQEGIWGALLTLE
jgi:hypothetical protein